MKNYVQLILRIGLGIVFFWFGIDKFINPEFWMSFIPLWLKLPISFELFIYIQGIIEAIIGLLIIIGLFTKIASSIAAIILIVIIASIGFNDISIRDFGLLSIAISLIFLKPSLSIDNILNKNFLKYSKMKLK